ncbi:MAG: eukaryotic-like serine/threonine-protein kinase [Pyrinomonadaceae bacterium]|jgi:serine/threonine-protein kinase|nr:eukaryotic-like serine/threonine-protein kinase [Pyrinomonadaceae bacterium]
MTDSDRRTLIERLYREALELDVAERQAFLARWCGENADLQREVESMLAAHDPRKGRETTPILQAPAIVQTRTPPPVFDLVGQTLDGRYYIEQKLISGGIGDLYLATDKPELMLRRVVVKVLQEKALEDKWVVTKFRQEIEALTRIDDPGVVGLLDAGTLPNGHPYLVMQFVEGDNLRSFMRADRGMEFDDVVNIWQQLGRTLTAAHERDVVHRDLKPENIMVRQRRDGSWQVKVIDFGIARIRNSLVAPSTVTARVAGTASYMSPEQVEGKRVSAASDVYALGVIAYEMVTGRRPFNPETMFQLSEMQKSVPLAPRALRPALPLAAERAILKALSYQSGDRYQKACDFADDLVDALLEDDSVSRQEVGATMPGAGVSLDPTSTPTMMATIQCGSLSSGSDQAERPSEPTVVSLLKPEAARFGSAAQAIPEIRAGWSRIVLAVSVVLLIALAGVFALKYRSWFSGPERSITYWLSVQRMYDGKTLGQPFDATGREYFHTGDKFVLNIITDQPGALYLIDEGLGDKGIPEWNFLFPTRKNNQGQAMLGRQQTVHTGNYVFTGGTGVEKVWVVWASQQSPVLDPILHDALDDGVIHNPAQQAQLQGFLKQYESLPTDLVQDEAAARSVLKGRGDLIVRRLEFSHKPNS